VTGARRPLAIALASAGLSAVMVGLVLSAFGDVLLDRGLFVPGLLAFLLAHVSYAAGFVAARPQLLPLRAAPFLAFGGGVYVLLQGGLGPMAVPVGAPLPE
jgi:alkenylglycerophosphocholine hydrolase